MWNEIFIFMLYMYIYAFNLLIFMNIQREAFFLFYDTTETCFDVSLTVFDNHVSVTCGEYQDYEWIINWKAANSSLLNFTQPSCPILDSDHSRARVNPAQARRTRWQYLPYNIFMSHKSHQRNNVVKVNCFKYLTFHPKVTKH